MARAKAAVENSDQKTLDLIKEVNRQKAEISKLERPNWKTNCSFSYIEGSTTGLVSLHVEMNVKALVSIAAFLQEKEESYKRAAAYLNVDAPDFTWNGFPVKEWLEDVATRINKIQIGTKKKKLEALEERLTKIISPDLRAKLELQAIEAELG